MTEVVSFVSATHGAVARVRVPMATGKGKTKVDWLPWAVHADTAEEAEQKASEFYRSELERAAERDGRIAAGRAKAQATRQAKREKA